jgi:hypothetical protein
VQKQEFASPRLIVSLHHTAVKMLLKQFICVGCPSSFLPAKLMTLIKHAATAARVFAIEWCRQMSCEFCLRAVSTCVLSQKRFAKGNFRVTRRAR